VQFNLLVVLSLCQCCESRLFFEPDPTVEKSPDLILDLNKFVC
jgi:hypothetical protein